MILDEVRTQLKLTDGPIKLILKKELNYRWRKPSLRPIQAVRPDVLENRRIFPLFLKAALMKGARLVFIDESSFNSRHLKFRSWVSLDEPSHI